MSQSVTAELSDSQLAVLERGSAGILITVDEDGLPTTAFVWLVAASRKTVRFATEGASTLANLSREGGAALQILGSQNQVFLVKGTTSLAKARLEALPFDSTMMSLHLTEVKDQTWPEVFVSPLTYEWTSDRRDEWRAIEQAVYQEMKNWQG
jgi:hypothetical protein